MARNSDFERLEAFRGFLGGGQFGFHQLAVRNVDDDADQGALIALLQDARAQVHPAILAIGLKNADILVPSHQVAVDAAFQLPNASSRLSG